MERCQISISTVVARKTVIVRAGLFDENLGRCDDYDMWLRAAFHGAKIAYTRNVQARLNGGRPGSLSVSRARMSEAYWKILEKTLQTLPLSPADREVVQNRTAEIRAQYLLDEGKHQLQQEEFDQARTSLSEANAYLRRSKVSLVLVGLAISPERPASLPHSWKDYITGATDTCQASDSFRPHRDAKKRNHKECQFQLVQPGSEHSYRHFSVAVHSSSSGEP